MRPLRIAVATVLAALAVPLVGCAEPTEYRATTVKVSKSWSSGSFCHDPTKDGGQADITGVLVTRARSSLIVTFTLRRLPTSHHAAAATLTFYDKARNPVGIFSTTWKGRGVRRSVTTIEPASSRTSPGAATPILDPAERSITTTYPSEPYVDSASAGLVWKADTTLDGKRQDSCTNNPRAFRAGKAHATGGNR